MPDAELTRLLRIVEDLAAGSAAENVEYWRGYRQGVQRRFRGIAAEDEFQHRFWMGVAVRGRRNTGFEKYAAGYHEGFEENGVSAEALIARLRALADAGQVSRQDRGRPASAPATAKNCWEFMNCGREKGGAREMELGVCPAYPDYGRSCARLLGTLCGGEVHGSMAKKLNDCMICPFFQSGHYERIKDKY